MILCRNCNVNIPRDAIFCPYCGCRTGNTPTTSFGNFNSQVENVLSSTRRGIDVWFKGLTTLFVIITFVWLGFFLLLFPVQHNDYGTPGPNDLTLEKVMELSEKGQGLSWSDFDNFVCEEERYNKVTGEQSRIYRSHFNYTFSISISGQRGKKPEKILLMPKIGGYNNNVDLRNTEEVTKFVEKNKSGLIWK